MKNEVLYHGSKTGIKGAIIPNSHKYSDFGKGFYMGTSTSQVKSLVSNAACPTFYQIGVDFTGIPDERIWVLSNEDWFWLVLVHRGYLDELPFVKDYYFNKERGYDFIIGDIADDGLSEALDMFADCVLTDYGVLEAIKKGNLGKQYVAKTYNACKHLTILKERRLSGGELQEARQDWSDYRYSRLKILDGAVKNSRGKGQYFDQIIAAEKGREDEWRKRL